MPAFQVQQFRSELTGDGARPNLFEVNITLPASGFANLGSATDVTRKLSFLCRAAQLPGSVMGQTVQYYFGRETKLPGNPQYPEWTITVINDEDFKIRNSFEKWMNGLNSHAGNIRNPLAYNNLQYTSDFEVYQYGKNAVSPYSGRLSRAGAIKKYKFIGAWPTDISPIELDWGQNDTIEEFQVTFAYQWWESEEDGVTT